MAIDEKKLIDKEKLLSELGFVCAFLPCGIKSTEDELRKWIEKQPEISLENKTSDNDVPDICFGKWIPCSEGLPIHEGEYLVTCKGKYRHFTEVLYFQHGRFLSCLCEVVAWFDAPLPEPYKGE